MRDSIAVKSYARPYQARPGVQKSVSRDWIPATSSDLRRSVPSETGSRLESCWIAPWNVSAAAG